MTGPGPFTTLRYDKCERVAVVTLDRPECLNAMNPSFWVAECLEIHGPIDPVLFKGISAPVEQPLPRRTPRPPPPPAGPRRGRHPRHRAPVRQDQPARQHRPRKKPERTHRHEP